MKDAIGQSAQPAAHTSVANIGPLRLPIPDRCSDQYAAGWAFADALIRRECSHALEPDASWHYEKVAGFQARFHAEQTRKSPNPILCLVGET